MKTLSTTIAALMAVLGMCVSTFTGPIPSIGTTLAGWVDAAEVPIGNLQTGSLALIKTAELELLDHQGVAPNNQTLIFRGDVTAELVGDLLTANATVAWAPTVASQNIRIETTLDIAGVRVCQRHEDCERPFTIAVADGQVIDVELRVYVPHNNVANSNLSVGSLSIVLEQTSAGAPLSGGWYDVETLEYANNPIAIGPLPAPQPECPVEPPIPPDGTVPQVWAPADYNDPGVWVVHNCRTFQALDQDTGLPGTVNAWAVPGENPWTPWHELGRLVETLADGTQIREWTQSGRFVRNDIVYWDGVFYQQVGNPVAPRTEPPTVHWAGWEVWQPAEYLEPPEFGIDAEPDSEFDIVPNAEIDTVPDAGFDIEPDVDIDTEPEAESFD